MYNQSLVEDLIIKTEEYTKTSYDLSRLKLMDKSSSVISSIAAVLACGIILFISILIASFGLSLYLGELLGKTYYGFFCRRGRLCSTSGFLLLLFKHLGAQNT